MATNVIGPALGAAQLAATLSGAPFASGSVMVLQMINTACSQVSVHKRKSAQLVQRCTTLLNLINDQSSVLAGTDMATVFDETEGALLTVHRRIQKWTRCGKFKRFLKSAQIGRDLDKCYAEVNIAMERLHVSNPITMMRMQQQSIDIMQHHQANLEERLQQLLISPREIERAVQQHNAGGDGAHQLMRLGQERLLGIRGEECIPDPLVSVLNEDVVESPVSSRPPSPITTVQNQIEQALLDLHRLTNIPPTIPILNNQVKKTKGMPTRGGPYSQIYEGRWLGEKKVALKTLRILNDHDPKAQRLQMRFEHEIIVWSKLKHENVLTMLGIVTNMGLIHTVSPWQLNDNTHSHRYENPDVNPLKLLSQAAKGLEYLHSQQIIHGHIASESLTLPLPFQGTVTLSDFGLTQILNDVLGQATMVVLTNTSTVRWHAPELNNGEETTPTMASDVFAFGMSVLELLTMKNPYSHRKRDITVVQDLSNGVLPPRPAEPEAVEWMTDGLWEALNNCWQWKPEDRMVAERLSPCLEDVSASLGR
ncbi:kinase-like domain-containing protein [Melanogaster broomeanus]|nr:kinase-like domain-containing protein [Melanogaster broomeanus]